VVTVPDTRWKHCDIKSTNLLPKVMMSEHAEQQDAYEALFVGDNGEVFEGTSTNVFVRQQGRLRTPSDSSRVLPGITRREVVDIASKRGMELDFGQVLLSDAMAADEVFLTGTLTEVLGVTRIDGMDVGGGEVGPVTRQLHDALRNRARPTDDQ
jgi:D-alanine transaminase